MNANLKKVIGLTLLCLVLAGCDEAKKEAVKAAAAVNSSDEWSTENTQYGPACNQKDKNHKLVTPGGCTKKQWADWNLAQPIPGTKH